MNALAMCLENEMVEFECAACDDALVKDFRLDRMEQIVFRSRVFDASTNLSPRERIDYE